jgi:hypothetical protein
MPGTCRYMQQARSASPPISPTIRPLSGLHYRSAGRPAPQWEVRLPPLNHRDLLQNRKSSGSVGTPSGGGGGLLSAESLAPFGIPHVADLGYDCETRVAGGSGWPHPRGFALASGPPVQRPGQLGLGGAHESHDGLESAEQFLAVQARRERRERFGGPRLAAAAVLRVGTGDGCRMSADSLPDCCGNIANVRGPVLGRGAARSVPRQRQRLVPPQSPGCRCGCRAS